MKGRMMFAERTEWDMSQNEITLAIEKLKQSSVEIFDLTRSNPTRCGYTFPEDVIFQAFAKSENLIYDPQSQGMRSAREAVSAYYASKGIPVDPDNIFLTASTSEGYSLLFKLLANPGDSVLFPRPSYPLFQFLGDTNDVRIEYYSLEYHRKWMISEPDLSDASNPVKTFVLVNPNNPTGSIISREELSRVNQFCQSRKIAIICDEVFSDYLFPGTEDYFSLADNQDVLTFTMGGLSKTLAMPQMKLSWIVVSGPEPLVAEAKQRLEVITDTYLSVNTPVQNALASLMSLRAETQGQIQSRIACNLSTVETMIADVPQVALLKAEGGWYAVLQVEGLTNEEQWILDLIEQDQVLVHPGYFYDFEEEGYIVLSLIVDADIFREGMKRFLQRVKSL